METMRRHRYDYVLKLSASLNSVIFLQEILLMKQRVAEMEREANKLRELQAAAEKEANSGEDGSTLGTEDDKQAADGRSIYVGNVSTTLLDC